jgi:multicomponent Na+:H+ antiporter subunit G
MNQILTYVGTILVLIGVLFQFLGALGIFRLPDVYNRMQAGTKATTLGSLAALVGIGLMHPAWLVKLIIIALFLIVTNPISSSVLARAAYRAKIPLVSSSKVVESVEKAEFESRDTWDNQNTEQNNEGA